MLALTCLPGCREEPPGAGASRPAETAALPAGRGTDASEPPTPVPDGGPDATAEVPSPDAHERIRRCCVALSARGGDGGLDAASTRWDVALSVCRSIARQVERGMATEAQARTLIREQLQGGKPPEGC
ncbi:MAG: hypothetical protein KF718_09475 [Polyangiaceae bacterium]|nr:hypothetical protein [Polyangiaceae bacterium]